MARVPLQPVRENVVGAHSAKQRLEREARQRPRAGGLLAGPAPDAAAGARGPENGGILGDQDVVAAKYGDGASPAANLYGGMNLSTLTFAGPGAVTTNSAAALALAAVKDQAAEPAAVAEAAAATAAALAAAPRDEQDRMQEWRRQWRRIMSCAVMYFDGVDPARLETIRGHLQLLGTRFQPFFETTVTHVVTERALDGDLPPGDVLHRAREHRMKVWTLEKLVRFLTSLLGHSPTRALSSAQSLQLRTLLRQEKLAGPTDRDPNTRREDYIYFRHPYVLVWDPSHYNRPIMHKQWAPGTDYPQLHQTAAGACPFVPEPPALKRRRREAREREAREREARVQVAKEATQAGGNATVETSGEGSGAEQSTRLAETAAAPEAAAAPPSPTAERPAKRLRGDGTEIYVDQAEAAEDDEHPSALPAVLAPALLHERAANLHAAAAAKKPTEPAASGLQRYSATSAVRSTTQSGTGLEASGLLASREVASLQRKVLAPAPLLVAPAPPRPKAKKPGFCENCLERYDNLDSHVVTKKHRRYAETRHNFDALDRVIAALERQPARTG